jgi:hypothetical protein
MSVQFLQGPISLQFIFEVDENGKLTQTPTGESASMGVKIDREFSVDGMVMVSATLTVT